jgi:hypothetical protein
MECDNRLTWFLPELTEKYSKSGLLVIVNREHKSIAKSYNKRWRKNNIMKAYSQGILMRPLSDNTLEVCEDYVEYVYKNLSYFEKMWDNVIHLDIDEPREGISSILNFIDDTSKEVEVFNYFSKVYSNKNNPEIFKKIGSIFYNFKCMWHDITK